ncbi:MAG: hypothetical protein FJ225_06480 [Lentisphaerae bacterium]|nr:hypothetical protein [Lentisphaerota bacterium]
MTSFPANGNSDTCARIAREAQGISGNAIVGVSSFDPQSGRLVTQAVLGMGTLAATTASLLGRGVSGWTATVPAAVVQKLATGRLHLVEGGVYELFFGQLPLGVAHWLERLAGVTAVYAAGLVAEARLLGNVAVVLRAPERRLRRAPELEARLDVWSRMLAADSGPGVPAPAPSLAA